MDDQPNDRGSNAGEIDFGKGRLAKFVVAPAASKASDLASQLALAKPRAVILIIGGADDLDDALKPQLEQLFSRGIARAALDAKASIIDGGTQSGVMSLMGEGVADRGNESPLIGVAPAPKVTFPGGPQAGSIEGGAALDPNHKYFALVEEPEWGDEVDLIYGLAEEISQNMPVVAVLVNGGAIAKEEALRCVRHQWPIIVIEESGRLADDVAAAAKAKDQSIADPDLAEIVAEGDIHFFSKKGAPAELRRLVVQQLSGNSALRLAWERFAKYDGNAGRQQKTFGGLLAWTIWLGVGATVLAVVQKELSVRFQDQIPDESAFRLLSYFTVFVGIPPVLVNLILARLSDEFFFKLLKYTIIVFPITISILVAAANRFKTGKKWVLLRGGAEAIKREIFHYRTRTGIYSESEVAKSETATREVLLSQVVGKIARRISQTEVNELALKPYNGSLPPPYAAAETDDGMSMLSPEAYIAGRLDDQLKYFESKSVKLERQIQWRQWAIYIVGGVGTLLAALEYQIWIAVSTAFATALAAHLEHFQLESSLVKYNQSASDLATVKGWWRALSKTDQANPANRDLLVESTERILENELTGWVQRMQDAMEKISAAEGAEDEDAEDEGKEGRGDDEQHWPAERRESQTPEPQPKAEE